MIILVSKIVIMKVPIFKAILTINIINFIQALKKIKMKQLKKIINKHLYVRKYKFKVM